MGLELVKKEVDVELYEFEQFGAKKSTALLIRISKIAGPSVKALFGEIGAAPSAEEIKRISGKAIGLAIQELLTNIGSEDEVVSLIETLVAEKCLCNGKKIHFDSHYQNRLLHLGKVLAAALEVQYGNFFSDAIGLLGSRRAPTTAANPA